MKKRKRRVIQYPNLPFMKIVFKKMKANELKKRLNLKIQLGFLYAIIYPEYFTSRIHLAVKIYP